MDTIPINKILINCVLLLLSAIILGAMLITAANYLPINKVNQQASLSQLSIEGWFPEVPSTAWGGGMEILPL